MACYGTNGSIECVYSVYGVERFNLCGSWREFADLVYFVVLYGSYGSETLEARALVGTVVGKVDREVDRGVDRELEDDFDEEFVRDFNRESDGINSAIHV